MLGILRPLQLQVITGECWKHSHGLFVIIPLHFTVLGKRKLLLPKIERLIAREIENFAVESSFKHAFVSNQLLICQFQLAMRFVYLRNGRAAGWQFQRVADYKRFFCKLQRKADGISVKLRL